MAVIDVVALALLFAFVLLGAVRGVVRDVVMLVGLLSGAYLAWRYGSQVQRWLESFFPQARSSLFLGHVLVFVAVVVAAGLLGALASRLLNLTPLGWLDRFLGACVGLARGVALVWVLVTVTLVLHPAGWGVVRTSSIARAVVEGGNRLLGAYLPRPAPNRDRARRRGAWVRHESRSLAPAMPCRTA